ncbi:CG13895 [Drosophila busckii]|uniref:CG13895 n=1 Tax=Drosophila busckii TaxID=30019 RepID=A0A0M4ECT2_DROBS|nr:uncharacterized protein LOC108598740 [Drosophila busckii]XP_017840965.1 uncharacterized protein LOC108598740 [Drosophila busckii]ALC43284.1 CG13895 [Drosophila busckii]
MSDEDSNNSQRIRNVLTLEERVEVIRQYDLVPMYSKIAKNFNCSWEQIKSIVSNRESIMEFYEATKQHNNKSPDTQIEELRKRKLLFLGHCLYEYIQRAQFYLHADINEELIRNKALEFQTLMGIEHFTPNKPWINHFKAAYNITLSNRQITITRKPPRSLNLRDIMSYCGKNSASNNLEATDVLEKKVAATSAPALIRKPMDIRTLYRTKTFVTACSQNQATLDEVQLRRKRKINFLEKALYEYISRSQLHHKHKSRLDMDNLREVAINLRDILKIENFFPDRTWFNHFKSHYNFNFSGVPEQTRRVNLSLDLRDIVSYCGRHEQREQPLSNITLTPKEAETAALSHVPLAEPKAEAAAAAETKAETEDDEDDCIAIEPTTELIEIKDDEEDEQQPHQSATEALKRQADNNNCCFLLPSPLKIQKIESLNKTDEPSKQQQLTSSVKNYEQALQLLKPLEDFALLEEDYRAIGLLTQLEKVFESALKAKANNNNATT